MRARGQRIEQTVNLIVRQTAIAAVREVVLATPVDTGRARSNWLVTLGGPSDDQVGDETWVSFPSPQQTIDQANVEVAARQPNGQDVYITNNVPYISRLNEGSSAQAPAGFVQQAVQRAAAAIRNWRVTDGN
jgi:hypothetical protein